MADEIRTGASLTDVTADAAAPPRDVAAGVPWSGLGLVLVWMVGALCVAVSHAAVKATHLLDARYPPADADSASWLMLWATVLACPMQLLLGVLAVRVTSDARPAEMGLTNRRLVRNVLAGVALAGPLALLVYGVQLACEALTPAQEHTFARLAARGMSPPDWAVLIAAALIAAPVWEEFLFRGLAQPWAIDRPWGGWVMMGLAVVMALLNRVPLLNSISANWFAVLTPVGVVLALVPIYAILEHGLRRRVAAGLFATAVLFGWVHVAVWPSPVALTLLGVGLGWLRWRSGSLAGPIALHAAFNAVAVAMLLWQARGR